MDRSVSVFSYELAAPGLYLVRQSRCSVLADLYAMRSIHRWAQGRSGKILGVGVLGTGSASSVRTGSDSSARTGSGGHETVGAAVLPRSARLKRMAASNRDMPTRLRTRRRRRTVEEESKNIGDGGGVV